MSVLVEEDVSFLCLPVVVDRTFFIPFEKSHDFSEYLYIRLSGNSSEADHIIAIAKAL